MHLLKNTAYFSSIRFKYFKLKQIYHQFLNWENFTKNIKIDIGSLDYSQKKNIWIQLRTAKL